MHSVWPCLHFCVCVNLPLTSGVIEQWIHFIPTRKNFRGGMGCVRVNLHTFLNYCICMYMCMCVTFSCCKRSLSSSMSLFACSCSSCMWRFSWDPEREGDKRRVETDRKTEREVARNIMGESQPDGKQEKFTEWEKWTGTQQKKVKEREREGKKHFSVTWRGKQLPRQWGVLHEISTQYNAALRYS